jgi:hypothetical protein
MVMPQTEITRPIVWEPLKGTSQEIALDTRCHHTLYCGTRGPGKTDVQIMRFRRRVGMGYGAFWRGVIFDREYKHLDDLVSKSKRWFYRFKDGAEFKESTVSYKWVWPTGEELLFRVVKDDDDYWDYHGQEFPFIGWNELTKYPTPVLYQRMMSCNRSSFTPEKDSPRDKQNKIIQLIPPIPLEVYATTNSFGVGRAWVKAQFIDPAPYGQIVRTTVHVFNPQTQKEEDIVRTQVAIFGSYKENKYLDPVYVAGLTEMCANNENLRKSWLEGDWDVVAGGAFDDVWNKKVHVLPRFKIPSGWHIDRAFDWGSSQPFSVGWWAEANGEEAYIPICSEKLGDGKRCNVPYKYHTAIRHKFVPYVFCPKPGSLIKLDEWYGTKKIGTNLGLKLAAGKIADGIIERELELMKNGWIDFQPFPGPADNSIRDVKEVDEDTIEKKMADKGVRWTSSDKSPGSRKIGMELMRERLENAVIGEGMALYFMDNCIAAISTIPVLPRDEKKLDDVDTDAEDHSYDETRYRVLKGYNRYAKEIKIEYPN